MTSYGFIYHSTKNKTIILIKITNRFKLSVKNYSELVECNICERKFKNQTGLKLHLKVCEKKNQDTKHNDDQTLLKTPINSEMQLPPKPPDPSLCKNHYRWGNYDSDLFENNLNIVYEKIVYWRKNLFLLPSGKYGKAFINETTRLLNSWVDDSPLKNIAFKAIMIMPSLLLQKPSKESKAKDHVKALDRRMMLWHSGDLIELMNEGIAIQERLPVHEKGKSIGEISRLFAKRMQKGNISSALKLLSDNMQNGILPLNDETLRMLKQKHPKPSRPHERVLLPDKPKHVHPVIFENLTADKIRRAMIKTTGGSGPSGMDSDGWKRILLGSSFRDCSTNLCNSIALVARKLCTIENLNSSLESLLACRLIPLNKFPGLRPIGVGEILRRVIGKAVISINRDSIIKSVGSLQVCAGHEAGCEAAVHAMREIFNEQDTQAILIVDAANAFNSVNRNVFLHNIKVICPEISIFVANCYSTPSRLFIIGGVEISSAEGTTQGDPVAMAVYATAIIPLILMVLEITDKLPNSITKCEAYADDIAAGGTLENLLEWWKAICELGPLFGYYPEESKSWLVVK